MNIDQKIQELCLILIKISVYVRRLELRHRIEKLTFDLLEQVGFRDFDKSTLTIAGLYGLIRFGKTIYEIEPVNADSIINQLNDLLALIGQIAGLSQPDLEKLTVFNIYPETRQSLFEDLKPAKKKAKSPKSGNQENNPAIESGNPAMESGKQEMESGNQEIASGNTEIESGKNKPVAGLSDELTESKIRQTAIIDKIRQLDRPVQLREIVAAFPNVSDRTIRYDLQLACNQGILEKNGLGPATSYKIRVI